MKKKTKILQFSYHLFAFVYLGGRETWRFKYKINYYIIIVKKIGEVVQVEVEDNMTRFVLVCSRSLHYTFSLGFLGSINAAARGVAIRTVLRIGQNKQYY